MRSQVGISTGGQNTAMAKDLLYFKQINACFNQVGGITVAQAMRGNLFFKPQALTTLHMVC